MKKSALLAGAALVLAVAALYPLPVLEVRAGKGGGLLFVRSLRPGDTFSLSFIHSVEKSPVRDHFKIDEGYRIVLYETAFRSLNTGLPTDVSGGEHWVRADGEFHVVNRHRFLPEIRLPVDSSSANTLEIGGRRVSLPALAGDGLLVIRTGSLAAARYGFERLRECPRSASIQRGSADGRGKGGGPE
jgi:hypothetical protein